MPTPQAEPQPLPPIQSPDGLLVDKVNEVVSYHKPDQAGVDAISNIRYFTAQLIVAIVKNCPNNADRSAAIRKAREAMMSANASIVVPSLNFTEDYTKR